MSLVVLKISETDQYALLYSYTSFAVVCNG